MLDESSQALAENPWGAGFGNWRTFVDVGGKLRYPHNLFIEVLVEHGIIVGSLFIIIVVVVAVRIIRASKHSEVALGVAAWLVAEIVNVSVSGGLNARTFFFVLTLAFLVAVNESEKTTTKKAPGRSRHSAVVRGQS